MPCIHGAGILPLDLLMNISAGCAAAGAVIAAGPKANPALGPARAGVQALKP